MPLDLHDELVVARSGEVNVLVGLVSAIERAHAFPSRVAGRSHDTTTLVATRQA
jgi:hypothetical protein